MATLNEIAQYTWETYTPRTLSAGSDSAVTNLELIAEYVWETYSTRTLTSTTIITTKYLPLHYFMNTLK